ncbi:MAG: RNA 2',3'-cyclic phosphodiesterase [Candidatus Omnitrophota bacterium]|nr:RNA 2',3'-cyclic phosphodiesterase [Candidatus Omnitrophota bacterium]
MRTFIAIELTNGIQDKLASLQEKLKSASADVKWVNPSNIHLTLKFLGDTDEKKIDPIKNIINKLAIKFKAFNSEVSGLGAFPNLQSPRVIWAGLSNADTISAISETLEDGLEKLGFPKEKHSFKPHLTLGRVRCPKNIDILEKILAENLDFKAGILEIKTVCLIESKLSPKGPAYTTIYSKTLA